MHDKIEKFLASKSVKPATLSSYRWSLEAFGESVGGKRLEDITEEDLEVFYESFSDASDGHRTYMKWLVTDFLRFYSKADITAKFAKQPKAHVYHSLESEIKEFTAFKGMNSKSAALSYPRLLRRMDCHIQKPLSTISIEDIYAFKETLNHFSEAHITYHVTVIREFFKYFTLKGTPCLRYEFVKPPKARIKTHKFVTPEEYGLLLAETKATYEHKPSPLRLRNLITVRLLWESGVRIGELLSLRIENFNFAEDSATVATLKTKSSREIFFMPETTVLIQSYAANRKEGLLFKSHSVRNYGKDLSARNVQHYLYELSNRVGLRRTCNAHGFRHGRAHVILHKGGQLADIARVLGHKNVASSFRYLNLSDLELRQRARSFL